MPTVESEAAATGSADGAAAWSFGMSVAELLELPELATACVLAGSDGLTRSVQRLNMMEVPDVLPWVRRGELLVTSGYPLRDLTSTQFADLVRGLSGRGLAGLCIKVGRFVPEVPANVVQTADGERFPVLAMPAELAFTDLLSAVVAEQLQRQETVLRASDEIDRLLLGILLEGGGHQEVSEKLSEWLCLPVAIADAVGDVVAFHPTPPDERLLERGRQLRLNLKALPESEHDVVAHKGTLAVARIRSVTGPQGFILVDGATGTLVRAQLLALRRAAPVVALGFSRANEVRAVEARFRGDFLRDLLLGADRGNDDVLEHGRLFGWDLDGPLLVGVIEPTTTGTREEVRAACARIGKALQGELRDRWPGAVVHSFATEVVAVLPAPAREQFLAAFRSGTRRMARSDRPTRTGCSVVPEGHGSLPSGYQQATEAMRSSGSGTAGSDPVFFDDLGLARIVALVAESGRGSQFVDDVLSPVLEDRNGEILLQTLETFLAANCNIAETSKQLHLHYNTVRYRLSRLDGLLGPFVTDAEQRAVLLAACRLRRRLGSS